VEDELHHPFRELVERLLGVQVEEPEQVDEHERSEEAEHDRGGARHALARAQECERQRAQVERHVVREQDAVATVIAAIIWSVLDASMRELDGDETLVA